VPLLVGLAGQAQAQPTITSSPINTAAVGYPWAYDDDGLPEATGAPPIEWSLVDPPAGMAVHNLSGEIYWVPQSTGLFTVTLQATDEDGSVTQVFDVDVQDAVPPEILLDIPPDGFQLATGTVHTLSETAFLPTSGTLPIYFEFETNYTCSGSTSYGFLIVSSVFPDDCEMQITATNWVGSQTLSFTIHFYVDESATLVRPSLTADPLEGDAPLTVTFDGTATEVLTEGLNAETVITFTHDINENASQMPYTTSQDLVWTHTYTQPGTYHARMVVAVLPVNTEDAFWANEVAEVVVVVSDNGIQPPVVQLSAEPNQGEAPLVADFTTETTQGDGDVNYSVLDYGDGDRFEQPIFVGNFEELSARHTYAQPGWYMARVRMETTEGTWDEDEIDIVVTDRGLIPPLARASASPPRGEVPLTTTLSGETGDLDGYVLGRYWVMPDGTINDELNPVLTFDTPGEHRIQLVAFDDDDLSSTYNLVLEVTKDGVLPPRIVSIPERTAVVGIPYAYGQAGPPQAVGGGPYGWSIGKEVGAEIINAPQGMTIEEREGHIDWIPTPDQVGEQPVTLLVENVAGIGLQEFVIVVAPSPDPLELDEKAATAPTGCACESGPPSGLDWFLGGLFALGWGSRRRRFTSGS
jgi:PKD repeat protein